MDGGVPAGAASVEEQSSSKVEPEETSAVDVSGNTLSCKRQACVRCKSCVRPAFVGKRGTSSNVVISREKFSSNLRV